MKRILEANAIGTVSHVLAEAYGPVVFRPKGSTWRTQKSEGGGCLYDYAAHPIDLLNWYFGMPESVGGTVAGRFSPGIPRMRFTEPFYLKMTERADFSQLER